MEVDTDLTIGDAVKQKSMGVNKFYLIYSHAINAYNRLYDCGTTVFDCLNYTIFSHKNNRGVYRFHGTPPLVFSLFH